MLVNSAKVSRENLLPFQRYLSNAIKDEKTPMLYEVKMLILQPAMEFIIHLSLIYRAKLHFCMG